MTHSDPRRAVIAHLTQPSVGELPAREAPNPGALPQRPTVSSRPGKPFAANADTIRFL
ncbi:MAG: hypothetical protein M3022_10765 [Actinomycetota bacterium]|nr:hypothetical protein [Actinomycetota bacterium]